MNYKFHKQFVKDLKKVPRSIQEQFLVLAESFDLESTSYKKITGYKNRYRVRIGAYRVGFSIEGEVVYFRRILHRQNIYKKFP